MSLSHRELDHCISGNSRLSQTHTLFLLLPLSLTPSISPSPLLFPLPLPLTFPLPLFTSLSPSYTHHSLSYSSYPDSRVQKDDKGYEKGVMGSVSLLQNVTVSSQPISSMDWSPDKVHKHTHRAMVYTTLLSTLLLLPPPSPSLLCHSCLLLLSPSLYPPLSLHCSGGSSCMLFI